MVDSLLTSIHTSSGGDRILTLDTDSFIIGDRVWVNGVRPGHIAYIGETRFAPGEWAGIALDDPSGKNDGSVGGRRYFYCAPNHGIFARLWRLTRSPLVPELYRPESSLSRRSVYSPLGKYRSSSSSILRSSSTSPERKMFVTTFRSRSPTRSLFRTGSPTRSLSSAASSLSNPRNVTFDTSTDKTVTTVTTTTTSLDPKPSLYMRVGDRVYVDSTKGVLTGRLRFLGHTDFAPGYWAGVELDEPVGKNDGSVAGKRYFWCPDFYGLFAPAYKVTQMEPKRMTTVTRIHRSSPEI